MESVTRYRSLAATTVAGGAMAPASMMRHLGIQFALMLVLLATACVGGAVAAAPTTSVKVAAVAFDPASGDVDGNIARMVAGIEDVAKQGVRLAVLPETATSGYIFDSFAMVKPYLDTVPGKATAAIEKVARAYQMYVAVGIAEIDPASGLALNSAALIGPNGYIGKYRKHGLNSQDQFWASVGNLGFPVFDTELGRISLLICYDDTYWQYARLAALHDVDIIAWSSVSDRVMPGTPAAQAKGDLGSGDAGHAGGTGQGRPLHGCECAIPFGDQRCLGGGINSQRH